MRELGAAAAEEGTCYLTGGTSAVLIGWRSATVAADIKLVPDQDALLRELPAIKDRLEINVELVSPGDFVPLPQGWEERSPSIGREGRLSFRHFDFYAQALSKLERAHVRDTEDVAAMIERGLVERGRLLVLFEEIEPELYRFPAIDPGSFRRRVEAAASGS